MNLIYLYKPNWIDGAKLLQLFHTLEWEKKRKKESLHVGTTQKLQHVLKLLTSSKHGLTARVNKHDFMAKKMQGSPSHTSRTMRKFRSVRFALKNITQNMSSDIAVTTSKSNSSENWQLSR
jgi:hypothetical protein